MSFKGKNALITGSSRGIGRGIALKLAEAGATIAVHYYQNEAAAEETLRLIKERGADGAIFQADVTKPDQIERLFKEVRSRFPSLDIFVSNARPEAVDFFYPPADITLDLRDGKSHRRIVTMGRHGIGQSCDGVAGAVFCGRVRETRDHGQCHQSGLDGR